MDKNSKVQTLNDFVRYGKTSSYSIYQLAMFYREDNTIFLDSLIYEKYDRLIMGMCSRVILDNDEYSKYRMNPERLSYDLYGTPNLSHLILYINRCSAPEFRKRNLQLIQPMFIDQIFQRILEHEQPHINKNHVTNL